MTSIWPQIWMNHAFAGVFPLHSQANRQLVRWAEAFKLCAVELTKLTCFNLQAPVKCMHACTVRYGHTPVYQGPAQQTLACFLPYCFPTYFELAYRHETSCGTPPWTLYVLPAEFKLSSDAYALRHRVCSSINETSESTNCLISLIDNSTVGAPPLGGQPIPYHEELRVPVVNSTRGKRAKNNRRRCLLPEIKQFVYANIGWGEGGRDRGIH